MKRKQARKPWSYTSLKLQPSVSATDRSRTASLDNDNNGIQIRHMSRKVERVKQGHWKRANKRELMLQQIEDKTKNWTTLIQGNVGILWQQFLAGQNIRKNINSEKGGKSKRANEKESKCTQRGRSQKFICSKKFRLLHNPAHLSLHWPEVVLQVFRAGIFMNWWKKRRSGGVLVETFYLSPPIRKLRIIFSWNKRMMVIVRLTLVPPSANHSNHVWFKPHMQFADKFQHVTLNRNPSVNYQKCNRATKLWCRAALMAKNELDFLHFSRH